MRKIVVYVVYKDKNYNLAATVAIVQLQIFYQKQMTNKFIHKKFTYSCKYHINAVSRMTNEMKVCAAYSYCQDVKHVNFICVKGNVCFLVFIFVTFISPITGQTFNFNDNYLLSFIRVFRINDSQMYIYQLLIPSWQQNVAVFFTRTKNVSNRGVLLIFSSGLQCRQYRHAIQDK